MKYDLIESTALAVLLSKQIDLMMFLPQLWRYVLQELF